MKTNNPYGRNEPNSLGICLIILLVLIMSMFFYCGVCRASELQASWYSIESLKQEGTYKYSKGVMANGNYFRDNGLTCATRDYALGKSLRITNLSNNKSVVVLVTDRIGKRFKGKRIDLSRAAFQQICSLDKGLCDVKVEVLK